MATIIRLQPAPLDQSIHADLPRTGREPVIQTGRSPSMSTRTIPIPPPKPPEPSVRKLTLTMSKPRGVVLRMVERIGKPPRTN